jgi:hypothetical protein
MSYLITPENRVLKDGEDVGFIHDGICYTNDPPKGRGIPAFRAMAGNPDLRFQPMPEMSISVGTAEESESFIPAITVNFDPSAIPPTGKEPLQVEPISSAAGVDNDGVMEPVVASDDATAGILSTPEPPRSAVLGDRDPEWQRWFIETHGEAAFKAKWPNRKLL